MLKILEYMRIITKTKHDYIIETKSLEFGFGRKELLLKNINLKIEPGSIYGFLGPNGAGKTTTIRLLLGLLKYKNGTINLFGRDISKFRLEVLSKTGSLIEQPSLYEHLSGMENLEITRQLKKIEKDKVEEALEIVNLTDAANKIVKTYSLGMKQRLGISIALLGQPKLLILDEPVNGLDPKGIKDMRILLKTINQEYGTTIFLSSHLIHEIEKLVTHLGIINMGELIFQGTLDNLRELCKSKMELHLLVDDTTKAVTCLSTKYKIIESRNKIIIDVSSMEEVDVIIKELVLVNVQVYQVKIENDLEQLFLSMTENYSLK